MRIVVAMSGGVDSSVAAALLQREGHDVVGISMRLYDASHGAGPSFGRCCAIEDVHDARAVAGRLGIPFYVLDLQAAFEQAVVNPFVSEYLRGRTPLPCAACNSSLKFESLLRRAQALGFERVATGHYARKDVDPANGRGRLLRGVDRAKDQSYFLFGLTQEQLGAAVFPVGHLEKGTVRRIAEELGLPTARKAESQEICFVPDGDYAAFIDGREPRAARPGPIVDHRGRTLGRHDGVHRFTVGQRRGLGLSGSEAFYVTAIDATTDTVVVGSEQDLLSDSLVVRDVNWLSTPEPCGELRAAVRIRYRHAEAPATIAPLGTARSLVVFDEPQRAVTPGQAAVFYDGELCLGGGWIDSVGSEGRARLSKA